MSELRPEVQQCNLKDCNGNHQKLIARPWRGAKNRRIVFLEVYRPHYVGLHNANKQRRPDVKLRCNWADQPTSRQRRAAERLLIGPPSAKTSARHRKLEVGPTSNRHRADVIADGRPMSSRTAARRWLDARNRSVWPTSARRSLVDWEFLSVLEYCKLLLISADYR